MPIRDPSIVQEWYKHHPKTTSLDIHIWTAFAGRTDDAHGLEFDYEDWLASDRSTEAPDLVEWVAWYGYMRLRLPAWKLPIQLTASEMTRWREAGYLVTVEDFQEALAKVAAGFAVVAGAEPELTVQVMQSQLEKKLADLERQASLPLEKYTPQQMPHQLRTSLEAHGFTGEKLKEMLELEMLEYGHIDDMKVFDKPFQLRQELDSFEWGVEKYRLIMAAEQAPDLGLPNRELYKALMQVDLNGLIARLEEIDVKLRRIWQHLASYNAYELNADYEPEKFWWRHWKKKSGRR